MNAIEYVIIPKLENTIKFVISELDEADREEFFRLKKVQGKKKQRIADAELMDLENQCKIFWATILNARKCLSDSKGRFCYA